MSSHSLQAERQSILDRMQRSRESYRRMLSGDSPAVQDQRTATHALSPSNTSSTRGSNTRALAPANQHSYSGSLSWVPGSSAVRVLTEHPILCALAVAAVVAVGPRRIVRGAQSVVDSGTKVTNLTLRNQANIAVLMQLITTVVDIMQRRNMRQP